MMRWPTFLPQALVAALAIVWTGPATAQVAAPRAIAKPATALPADSLKKLDPPPTAQQLAAWVQELDSDEFLVRETATENLIASGSLAFEPLQKTLASSSLEATTRALHVLQQLALLADFETQEAARELLEEAAAKRDTATGRRAATALVWLNGRRSSQALAELAELGANISRTQVADGLGGIQEVVDSIEIGSNWTGNDRDLRRLKWLESVNRLVLVGDKVGDEALQHAAKMQQLGALHAYHAKITDQGVAALAGMEKLSELGIYYVPISDAALGPLQNNKHLTTLRFYGTDITRPAMEKLQAALGLPKVDYRSGAFLGIGCESINAQCVISNVHPDSPADKGGIRSEDVLIQFDGKKVDDFPSLTALISNYKAGATVDVDLQRIVLNDENDAVQKKMTVKVTLGEWDVGIFINGRLAP